MRNTIDSFSGEFAFLSNFYFADVSLYGLTFPTNEHAFVYHKTTNPFVRRTVLQIARPGDVKRFGQSITLRSQWDDMRVDIMRMLVDEKFIQNPRLAKHLLATEDADLIEGNYWGDTFWGVCRGKGENHLGKLLMQTREMLRSQ